MTDDHDERAALIARLRDRYEWRFTVGGTVVHALVRSGDNRALCGVNRWPARFWLGTGSQGEYETAARLPECGKCVNAAQGRPPINRWGNKS